MTGGGGGLFCLHCQNSGTTGRIHKTQTALHISGKLIEGNVVMDGVTGKVKVKMFDNLLKVLCLRGVINVFWPFVGQEPEK